jgi:hypothetical protein
VGNRRDLLAIQTIVITFIAAVRALQSHPAEPDLRTLMVEQARDRALQLLAALEQNLPYEQDSVLDRSIHEARQRIEAMRLH